MGVVDDSGSSSGGVSASQHDEMLNAPAFPPPPGVVAIFDNPPNRNHVAEGLLIPCLILTSLFALLRVYSRALCIKKVFFEDCKTMLPLKPPLTGKRF
jgi:hypothetical protein